MHFCQDWFVKVHPTKCVSLCSKFKVWSVLTRTKVEIYLQILLVYFWLICFPFSIYIVVFYDQYFTIKGNAVLKLKFWGFLTKGGFKCWINNHMICFSFSWCKLQIFYRRITQFCNLFIVYGLLLHLNMITAFPL